MFVLLNFALVSSSRYTFHNEKILDIILSFKRMEIWIITKKFAGEIFKYFNLIFMIFHFLALHNYHSLNFSFLRFLLPQLNMSLFLLFKNTFRGNKFFQRGGEENEACRHLLQRLTVLLIKGNSALLSSQDPSHLPAPVDGDLGDP